MRLSSLCLLFLVFNICCSSQTVVNISLGTSRPIPPDLWGVVGQNTIREGISWATPELLKKLPELNPMLIRYPGTQGNWWDWKTGWFVQSEFFQKDYNKLTPGPDKPSDFKKAIDLTGATPIWMLNMVTADLQDQLAMLRHVKSIGMSVDLVELGSEFYLKGNKIVQEKYPTAQDYAKDANMWRDSIKKYFPQTKCAYIGCFTKGNEPNRRNTWDDDVASVMKNPDAITLHIYPEQTGDGINGNVVEIFSEPFRTMNQLKEKELKILSSAPEVWITEYNMNNNTAPVQGTWMHGLWVALMSMKFLEAPQINHMTYYAMCGRAGYGAIFTSSRGFNFGGVEFKSPDNPPTSTPFAFTATGSVMSVFGDVAKRKTSAAPIHFEGISELHCASDGFSYPSAYGWKFSNANSSGCVILNLSDKPVSIDPSKICSTGSHYNESYADPMTYIADGNEMKKETGTIGKMLSLKPYSITSIVEK